MRHNGILPGSIYGHRRNTLVRSYYTWKKNECPKHVHPAIKWSQKDPLQLLDYTEDAPWKLLNQIPKQGKNWATSTNNTLTTNQKPSKVFHNIPSTSMAGLNNHSDLSPHESGNLHAPQSNEQHPVGFIWASTYSCAYDAMLTIIFNLWSENKEKWTTRLAINDNIKNL
ncbi:hypothetical protein OE88DRAFT_1600181, partial [Heliocybe sulcata]